MSGLSVKDVATQLYLSPDTVKNHVVHIVEKLGRDGPDRDPDSGSRIPARPKPFSPRPSAAHAEEPCPPGAAVRSVVDGTGTTLSST
jgi:hypothetical protein